MKSSKLLLLALCFSASNVFGVVEEMKQEHVDKMESSFVEFHKKTSSANIDYSNRKPDISEIFSRDELMDTLLVARIDVTGGGFFYRDFTFNNNDDVDYLVQSVQGGGGMYVYWYCVKGLSKHFPDTIMEGMENVSKKYLPKMQELFKEFHAPTNSDENSPKPDLSKYQSAMDTLLIAKMVTGSLDRYFTLHNNDDVDNLVKLVRNGHGTSVSWYIIEDVCNAFKDEIFEGIEIKSWPMDK